MCISAGQEIKFLQVTNQRQTLLDVIARYITTNNDSIAIYYVCEECDETFFETHYESFEMFYQCIFKQLHKE